MCPIFTTLALLAIVGALLYTYLVWNFDYWKKRGIKMAKSYPLIGSFPSQWTQKRHPVYDIDDVYKQFKNDENFVGVISARVPHLLILSPEYAHKIYVNDFKSFHDNEISNMLTTNADTILRNNPFLLKGEDWKERRAEVTPGLTANRVGAVYPVTQKVCISLVNYIKEQIKIAPAEGLNTKEVSLRYTTEVVSDCVLGIKANSFSENPTPIFGMIKKSFEQSIFFTLFAVLYNIMPQIKYVYTARLFPKEVEDFFYSLVKTAVELRQKTENPADRTDFLNYLLYLKEKKGLTTFELTSHTITFLTDGFETTALIMTHTLLLLARNPEAMEKVRAEAGTKQLSFDELNDLDYLDACIHETMRIFPALMTAIKSCTGAYEFENKNGTKLKVMPGDVAIVPIYSLHHDPDIYEDPESFKPERYQNGGLKEYREMGAYFGFGDGPRVCLGMRFAMTQMKAAIVEIVRAFNIKPNPKTRTDNVPDNSYFMSTLKGGVYLDFEERH